MKQTVSAVMALAPAQTLDRRAIGDLEFSPDLSRLVFTVTEPVKGTARARARWLLDVASRHLTQVTGGQFTEIGAPRGPLGPFALSPDGKTALASTAPQP